MLAKARVRRRLGGQGGRLSRCRAFHTCISRFSLRTSTGRPISCVWRRVARRRVTVDEKLRPRREEEEEELKRTASRYRGAVRGWLDV